MPPIGWATRSATRSWTAAGLCAPACASRWTGRRFGFCGRRGGTCRSTATCASTTRWWRFARSPELAAEVTITAAEKLGVDAAIIFADLLLPLEPMGLDFEFQAGEGPVVHRPVRSAEDVRALRTDRAGDLAYVARAIEKVAAHFRDRLGVIGFCGAPYTLASYMIEGGGSRNYIETKQPDVRRPHCVEQPLG